ncbi:glycosyltransferase family 50 protein [Coniophora puteana RWD-64-598 SS2]|uniref:GPI mannosyltransferase 1 n=1 Tax=Coniophora puteana (strain RWD-64-598) TaxID=741705 RepID=A0A5M3N2G4_CONPW|nr:glycosyltransferase family 50 protein [Coniophora puteana RWD-64-598 SS2]EIW85091.1 glycosyltransferase family 50 protein [Coniophora puteana RWD-64-598 SS2]
MPRLDRWLPDLPGLLVFSAALRVALILYSEWHDARSDVKYTDVDYRVFSDAASYVYGMGGTVAAGPLAHWLGIRFGSPYDRDTYRYTPLLALLATPNEFIHKSFGKYLFAACDILNGFLIYRATSGHPSRSSLVQRVPDTSTYQVNQVDDNQPNIKRRAILFAAIHLLNPMVFSISTRGSSESVLTTFVLLTLVSALESRWDAAAIYLGLSTHWKIYPVIYGVSCVGVLGGQVPSAQGCLRRFVNHRTLRFTAISAGTFFALCGVCYSIWGYPFLYETYLYHLHRLDHRHNFSPYFYSIYLSYSSPIDSTISSFLWSPSLSLIPQLGLALGSGFVLGQKMVDLPFAWFVQTFAFVLFNRVCTSQYFLWYLVFIPFFAYRLKLSSRAAGACVVVWVLTQALWLMEAYKLEFLGENVFRSLWARGLIYLLGNAWVLGVLIEGYTGNAT